MGAWVRSLAVLAVLLVPTVAAPQLDSQWPSEGPPLPLPAPEVNFPPYEVRTLPNGLQVVIVLHHEQPAVSIRLLVGAGAVYDPPDKPGVASLVATLLDQGTTGRSAQEIADTIDNIGGFLGAGAGMDLSFANVGVMTDSFDLAMDLLAEVVRQPAFAQEEIERQRQQLFSGLQVNYDDPDYVADVVFDRLVYGFHPYGKPGSGTRESLGAITREDLVAFHRAYYAPNNSILAIVGDVMADEAFERVREAFGDWAQRDVSPPQAAEPPAPTRRIIVVDKPGSVQTEIRLGHLGISRKDQDYMAMNLAIRVLGGEGSNRLHRVLRSERGLTYSASADFNARKFGGDIAAETDTRSTATADALRLAIEEFWRLRREPVGERELRDAQAYLAGSFPLTIETPAAIASQVLNVVFHGLDLGELETFRERVNAVTVEDVRRVATEYLQPDRLSIVLVGDASTFEDDLRRVGFDSYERVPLADLDLTTADFRKPGAGALEHERAPVDSGGRRFSSTPLDDPSFRKPS